jgi:glycopeptide antibiotics resistance protein
MKDRRANLIPFSEPSIFTSENILNVLIFVPLGIYVIILFEGWTFGKKLLFFFLISLLIEGLQYVLGIGAFDVTDLITNTLGGVIGLLIFRAIASVFGNSAKAQKLVNVIAAIGTASMLLLLLLLKMNMLPIRYR